MSERNDSLVAEYLARVSRATAGLPADRRDELVRDLSEHIETSRADLSAETEVEVRGILERLGDPSVIARAAAEEAGLSTVSVEERPVTGARRGRLWLVAAVLSVIVLLILFVAVLFFLQDSQGGAAMAFLVQ